ncbi:hypothetical protein TD95_003834 [Thielaviopsis punctulata]|uniref:Glutamate-1-semialdehyde 2,1-aminomutase n=1 Tax=Thielaviopsis punctulata TaxID=72032 RepID=A0A0F4Z937_9PEZI|nr:hypothetical protein TD95_003834 [Thielaviopsis punctulata]
MQMDVAAAYQAAERRYVDANPSSAALYAAATASLPGGNTRTALYFAPFPLYMSSARGCTLTSTDARTYIDLLGEYSAGLYGHTHPRLQAEIAATAANGLSFGAQHGAEAELARLLAARMAGLQRVRFTNSGTEATMMALATAKIHTGRAAVLVFRGGYHGGGFVFGGSATPHRINVPHDYVVGTYNDVAGVERVFAERAGTIAAVLVEPVMGSGGGVCATAEFLGALRRLTAADGSLLVFDEVMTSRLFGGGGVQTELGITPDLTVLGKYIGGGFSFGAFGGRADVMDMYDPRRAGAVPHAGTFNNNVMTMRVGACGLREVFTAERARQLHTFGESVRRQLNAAAATTLMKVLGCGSIMVVHFTRTAMEQIRAPQDWADEDVRLLDLLHLEMLEEGFYMARRGFISLSLEIGQKEADEFVAAISRFLKRHKDLVAL